MRQKFKITLEYNYETDYTEIKVDEKFKELPTIHTMDFLKSACNVLTEVYDQTIDKGLLAHSNNGFDLFELVKSCEDFGTQVKVKRNLIK